MPKIDLSSVGTKTEDIAFKYKWQDVVLYALGVGAQAEDLPFVYEKAKGGLKVIPSFATIAGGMGLPLSKIPNIDFSRFIHGEMLIRLHKPFASRGKIINSGVLQNIYDKGKAAVLHSMVTGKDTKGEIVFEAKWTHFYIGAGGFGGDPGPKSEPLNPPEGVKPDFSISYKTLKNQAALYRLSGDYNPLHLDPAFARMGGQEKPILHGLCTYGHAARAILYGACDGDVTRFKEFKARFSNVVYPGETLTTEGWKTNGRYIIQVRTERSVAISNSYAIVE